MAIAVPATGKLPVWLVLKPQEDVAMQTEYFEALSILVWTLLTIAV